MILEYYSSSRLPRFGFVFYVEPREYSIELKIANIVIGSSDPLNNFKRISSRIGDMHAIRIRKSKTEIRREYTDNIASRSQANQTNITRPTKDYRY